MATPISEEELQLKKRARRRLIGAIALVTVVAVFLPMILDHEPKSVNQDISIQIPSQNAGVFTSKIVQSVAANKAEPPAAEPAPVVAPVETQKGAAAPQSLQAVAKSPEPAVVKTPEPEAKPKVKAPVVVDAEAAPTPPPAVETKTEAKSKPKPAKTVAKDSAGYVVQIAALADPGKAKLLSEKIVAAGVKGYTEVVPTSNGDVTRVRAGPFASRESAEKARDRLKAAGLNGNVVAK